MKNMPAGHKPKSRAWTADFSETKIKTLVYVQFGIQHKQVYAAREAYKQIGDSLQGPFAPRHVDSATTVDSSGYTNQVWFAFWDSVEAYEAWQRRDSVQEWFEGVPSDAEYGFWREAMTIPVERFESLHSGKNYDNGVSHFVPIKYTRTHEYWGAMRDRMRASKHDDFDSPLERLPELKQQDTFGRNIRVTAPDNVAYIRTAQYWTKCGPDQRETYETEVYPALEKAMDYLQSHDDASGCISSLLFKQAEQQTFVSAYFLSLKHLEDWAKDHPTHLEIFRVFFRMLEIHGNYIQLALWHEVCVLQSDEMELFYSNCHPLTGFLPHCYKPKA